MQEYGSAVLGGMLIGLAAVMMFWLNGRIMGVSGICGRLMAKPSRDSAWRASFIGGLIAGAWIYASLFPVSIVIDAPIGIVAAAGLLVGFGTSLGNGCTSGHGVCGIARLSKRSMIATFVFIISGILTVWLSKVFGGAG